MIDFAKLGLKKNIIEALNSLGYKEAMDVQEKIIPIIASGHHTVFTAMTGSGKTIAYSLNAISKINPKISNQVLIIVPTRELCIQVSKELRKICEKLNINVGSLYGGRDIHSDYKTLRQRNQIMVATPGRLIQHINEKHMKVGDCKTLVFDESDQMFDNGFYDDCAYLIKRVASDAQIILASATLTDKVREFLYYKIQNYDIIEIGIKIPRNIIQEKLYCTISEKNAILLNFFNKRTNYKRAIVFCNTRKKTTDIAKFLKDNKFNAKALSGSLTQQERNDQLNLFRDGKIQILITTDVAARGLHINDIDIVVNYDVPTREEFYVHRIGRSGRSGKKGYSITFVCDEDIDRFKILTFNYDLETTLLDHDFKRIPEEIEDEEDNEQINE